jgi:glycerol dehydrogenase
MLQHSCSNLISSTFPPLTLAPAQVLRGTQIGESVQAAIVRLGKRPLVVGGDRSRQQLRTRYPWIAETLESQWISTHPDSSEAVLCRLKQAASDHHADLILGVGGGKALDIAKLLASELQLPIATFPTSGATCAAWTALANVYSDAGAFLYDVTLNRCPDLLVLDYDLILTAPSRTLVAGIGDALAKWYEASVSSGHSNQTLVIAAVQQARVLRDILFQRSSAALQEPGGEAWQEVVDGTVLLAGVIGGLGGATCRTVAAHAVHNGLTHLPQSHNTLHGEKVAYGILVQLRLEEQVQKNQLAATARQQLLKFYREIGLPCRLEDLGLDQITLAELYQVAEVACGLRSDIHRLPFTVDSSELVAAMVSTTAPIDSLKTTVELVE